MALSHPVLMIEPLPGLAPWNHLEDAAQAEDDTDDFMPPAGVFERLCTPENWPDYNSTAVSPHQDHMMVLWPKSDVDDWNSWGQIGDCGSVSGAQGGFPMMYSTNLFGAEQSQQGLCSPVAGIHDFLADWSTASSAGTNTPPSEWSNPSLSGLQVTDPRSPPPLFPPNVGHPEQVPSRFTMQTAGAEALPFEWSSGGALSTPSGPDWGPQSAVHSPSGVYPDRTQGAPNFLMAAEDPPHEWGDTTTLMMRNLPNKYTQRMLLTDIKGVDFDGAFDFFYLPIDHSTGANKGYAFINFREPGEAWRFKQHYEGKRMSRFNSEKTVSVSPATLQGYDENYAHYANSRVNRGDPSCRPLFLREASGPPPVQPIERGTSRSGHGGHGDHGGFGGRSRGRMHQRNEMQRVY